MAKYNWEINRESIPVGKGYTPTMGLYTRDGKVFQIRHAKTHAEDKYAVYVGDLETADANAALLTTYHFAGKDWYPGSYIPGLAPTFTFDERITIRQAEQYGWKFGRCAWCGHNLSSSKSVTRGMGPVCYRNLRSWLKRHRSKEFEYQEALEKYEKLKAKAQHYRQRALDLHSAGQCRF